MILDNLSADKIIDIVFESFIPVDIKEKLCNREEHNYYFMFKNQHIIHYRDPMKIIELIHLCQANNILVMDYDIFIGDYDMRNVIRRSHYKSWETHTLGTTREVYMDIGIQNYIKRKSLCHKR